ncbi:MAG: (2Fe-2S)-binding protein [Aquificae bacterium]|nr:(2Fe-2S)-binding protein [Aquificota bacterium]
MEIIVNGKLYKVDVEKDKKLLWVLREDLKLTGTKYGCGKSLCGFCTVLVDGVAVRSCQITVSQVENKPIITIEGIPQEHHVKKAWIELDVPQCGYCQAGQIMQAVYLLSQNKNPTTDDIISSMYGNLCRCGTYQRILKAIKLASKYMRENNDK